MDSGLLVPVTLHLASVLKEAREKYPYLCESVALAEYHELQRLICKHYNLKDLFVDDAEAKARAEIAGQKKIIAANLHELFTVRKN